MEQKESTTKRGGKRKGAGRPRKQNNCSITIRCSATAYLNFKRAADKLGLSQSDFFNRQMEGLF